MGEKILMGVAFVCTLPLTILFLSWFTLLPAVGLLWMVGWLK